MSLVLAIIGRALLAYTLVCVLAGVAITLGVQWELRRNRRRAPR